MNFCKFDTAFGSGCFVWKGETIYRVFLPSPVISAEQRVRKHFKHAENRSSTFAEEIALNLSSLAAGVSCVIAMKCLDFGTISPFKRTVLHTLMNIPRGQTISYGELAAKAGFPGAARAVGSVMSSNPFPLAIPCHRVVKADGTAGSYQGGAAMKQYLLEAEIDRE